LKLNLLLYFIAEFAWENHQLTMSGQNKRGGGGGGGGGGGWRGGGGKWRGGWRGGAGWRGRGWKSSQPSESRNVISQDGDITEYFEVKLKKILLYLW
jgi:hypothetical protein